MVTSGVVCKVRLRCCSQYLAHGSPTRGPQGTFVNYIYIYIYIYMYTTKLAGPIGRAVYGVGLRPLARWVRIPPGSWMFFCCVCSVFSGRGLCDELVHRSPTDWGIVVCDQGIS
jgi:hypothetical protein